MDLGERVLSLLKQKGIKQKKFAADTGLAPGTVAGWAKANRNPSWEFIATIAEYLGVSEHYLLTGENVDESVAPTLNRREINIINRYRALPKDSQLMIEAVIDLETKRAAEWRDDLAATDPETPD